MAPDGGVFTERRNVRTLGKTSQTKGRAAMEIELLVNRSELLMQNLSELLAHPLYDGSTRLGVSAQATCLSLEHAAAVRVLVCSGMTLSAPAMLRCQFEALARGIWSLYCASEAQLESLSKPLDNESADASRSLPAVGAMLDQLGKVPVANEAVRCLSEFKLHSWKALNSYVHSGLHPLRRQADGYPLELAIATVRQSNGLAMLAGMQIAILTGVPGLQKTVVALNCRFGSCLPIPAEESMSTRTR